jgi:hypothetical protein
MRATDRIECGVDAGASLGLQSKLIKPVCQTGLSKLVPQILLVKEQ